MPCITLPNTGFDPVALGTELTGVDHYADRPVAKRDARRGSTQRIAEPILLAHRPQARGGLHVL